MTSSLRQFLPMKPTEAVLAPARPREKTGNTPYIIAEDMPMRRLTRPSAGTLGDRLCGAEALDCMGGYIGKSMAAAGTAGQPLGSRTAAKPMIRPPPAPRFDLGHGRWRLRRDPNAGAVEGERRSAAGHAIN